MSIPTHNLYDFVHQVLENKYWLMYFKTWGGRELIDVASYISSSNNINSVRGIDKKDRVVNKFMPQDHPEIERMVHRWQPILFCHDQEPLNYDLYLDGTPGVQLMLDQVKNCSYLPLKEGNLRNSDPTSWRGKWILLHSELNSPEVKRYEESNYFSPAYWWSHAVIARDWYRFAKIDRLLLINKQKRNIFLVYCRDTTGSRQYRQNFLDLLYHNNVLQFCQLTDPLTTLEPSLSAEYHAEDFVTTDISIVLETVCESSRIHLTEKTLRPIACGHPFILAAGPKSLEYLRSYGFKTFSPWIDETYDLESDPSTRLKLIVTEMKRLANLKLHDRQHILSACKEITQHNKDLFFSDAFQQQITNELITNVKAADPGEHDINISLRMRHWLYSTGNGTKHNEPEFQKTLIPFLWHIRCRRPINEYVNPYLSLDPNSDQDQFL